MIKPFDALYLELEKELKLSDRTYKGPERYMHGIDIMRDKIGKLGILGSKFVREGAKEVEYFRNVWPVFYGRLLLFIQLYRMELSRLAMPAEQWTSEISQAEGRVAAFFRENRNFWQYYRSGAPVINEQFTRAYSRGRIFEPLALVVDQDGATLASYRAAWCLAMEGLRAWLQEERACLSIGTISAADQGYSWGPTDADLAEWLFGLQAVGAIQYKGAPADMSRLQKWVKLALGREVTNIYDRGRVLRNRKKERLAFTKKIANALERKWDQAEGKFE